MTDIEFGPAVTDSKPSTTPASEPCHDCGGSGIYYGAGAVVNGVFKGFTGPCYRCRGTGAQTAADKKRNRYYDNHVRRIYA